MISLVLFGVAGYVCSQVIESPGIEIWVIVFITSILGALLSLLYYRPRVEVKGSFSIKNLLLGPIPYILLLPGAVALLYSVRIQLSAHGSFHLGYIYQILNGFAPPENVVLPEYPANVYWLFHALIATVAEIINTPPTLVAALVNIGAMIISLYWIRKALGLLVLKNKNSFITSFYTLFILFGASLFAAVHVALVNIIWGGLSLQIFGNPLEYNGALFDSDRRLLSLARKYLNSSGTPLGILFFCFTLYISLLILKGELTAKKILLLSVAISGALMFHTTSGIFTLLIIPFSLLITLLITNREKLNTHIHKTHTFHFISLAIIILMLFTPILHYIYAASKALPAETNIGTSIGYNLVSIFSVAYPILPFSILAIYMKYREKTDIILFFTTACILGFLLSTFADLPGDNQYKFIYLSTIAACFLSVIGLDYIYFNLKGKLSLAGKLIFFMTFILLSFNVLITGIQYLQSGWFTDKTYYYENGRISLSEGIPYKDSFEWIRGHTPPGTVVILPFPSKNTRQIDGLNGSVYIVTQRLPYVAEGHIYAEGIDEYETRKENVQSFYSKSTPIKKKVEILGEFEEFSKERPSMLLIPNESFKPLASYLDNLQLIYSGKDAKLYSFENK